MMVSNAQLHTDYVGLEAVDRFLAAQLCQSLGSQCAVMQHLIMALSKALRNGHSCLPLADIAGQTYWSTTGETGTGIAPVPGYTFAAVGVLMDSAQSYPITAGHAAPLVLENARLYLRRYWHYEQQVAQHLLQRMQSHQLSKQQQVKASDVLLQLFEEPLEAQINWQAQAVQEALVRQVSVISGGPGTGKTYTVARLLVSLQAVNDTSLTIAMAAPTGKAKQRLVESINFAKSQLLKQGIDKALIDSIPDTAHTLHGLLGLRPNSYSAKHHKGNPLPIDLLLVDEVSMVDLPMMARLLDALPEHCKLVLVGDAEQLPSVAAGSVLADIPSAAISYLHKSHRFEGQGGIGLLANCVMHNQAEKSWQVLLTNKDLSLILEEEFQIWLEQMCDQYFLPMLKAKTLDEAFICLTQFRILAATRQGEMGVEGLNEQVERLLSRRSSQVRLGQNYHGKPVMVTKNHHGLGLFNGDIGIVWAAENGQLNVCFLQSQEVRKVNVGLLQDLETVYAMTIHKTQGSEFQHVALVVAPQAERLLSSQLLYTAVTRAKMTCSIKVSQSVWCKAVSNKTQRWSGLRALLSR
ncbi:AAA family ATPase [Candidatus Njordibacter sp. Uisw_039]|jgi:exodeoxyribonuclease V alpha subunit|uniref:AAA family ATPase n=1 Tax=Candidatus Njordibacter sp. Uisw_039 TaxID=3230972 RepID=UPI003A21C8D8|tara:strand:+ start:8624 stop:10357 length:1734 start_codon:yes stop_codon:yes gene_type:complete